MELVHLGLALKRLEVERVAPAVYLALLPDGMDLPVAVGNVVAPGGLKRADGAAGEADHGLSAVVAFERGLVVVVQHAHDLDRLRVRQRDKHVCRVIAGVNGASAAAGV